jgi:hypothetical protein
MPGSLTANCFSGGTSTTITNSRLLRRDGVPVLESRATAPPSVRAMDRRGLVTRCAGYIGIQALSGLRGTPLLSAGRLSLLK